MSKLSRTTGPCLQQVTSAYRFRHSCYKPETRKEGLPVGPWRGWKTERQERRNGIPPKVEEAQKSSAVELCHEQLTEEPLVRHGRT